MPANLTAQYMAAEARFKEAASTEEKLEALREMLAVIPKHKGTEKLQADLKRKLSKLTEEQEQRHRSGGRRSDPGHVPREGAGQIVLLGPPNSGKSSILAALTNAKPDVAEYPFTTRLPLPGMMPFEDAQVQLVDTPPVAAEPFDAVLINVARGAEALLLVFDPSEPEVLDEAALMGRFLARCRIVPAGRSVPEEIAYAARVMPVVLGLNKSDLGEDPVRADIGVAAPADDRRVAIDLLRESLGEDLPLHDFSTKNGAGLEELRRALYKLLDVVRVYAKEPGKKPDLSRPFILKRGSTVLDLARLIHKDLAAGFRSARVWGSARFDGQPVERDHALEDRDVVEVHA